MASPKVRKSTPTAKVNKANLIAMAQSRVNQASPPRGLSLGVVEKNIAGNLQTPTKKKSSLSTTVESDHEDSPKTKTAGIDTPDQVKAYDVDFIYRDIPDSQIDENPKEPKKPKRKKGKKSKKGQKGTSGSPARIRSPTMEEKQARLVENLRLYNPNYVPAKHAIPHSIGASRAAIAEAGDLFKKRFVKMSDARKAATIISQLKVYSGCAPGNTILPNLIARVPQLIKQFPSGSNIDDYLTHAAQYMPELTGPEDPIASAANLKMIEVLYGPVKEVPIVNEPVRSVLFPRSQKEIITKLKLYEAEVPTNTITPKLIKEFERRLDVPPAVIVRIMTESTTLIPKTKEEAELLLANSKIYLKLDPGSKNIAKMVTFIESKRAQEKEKPLTTFIQEQSGIKVDLEGNATTHAGDFWASPEKIKKIVDMTGSDLNTSFKMGMESAAGAKINGMAVGSPTKNVSGPSTAGSHWGGDGPEDAERPASETKEGETITRLGEKLGTLHTAEKNENRPLVVNNYSLTDLLPDEDIEVDLLTDAQNSERNIKDFEIYMGIIANALTPGLHHSWLQPCVLSKIAECLPAGHLAHFKSFGADINQYVSKLINELFTQFYEDFIDEDAAAGILSVFVSHCAGLWRIIDDELSVAARQEMAGLWAMNRMVLATIFDLMENDGSWESGILLLNLVTMWFIAEWIMTGGDFAAVEVDAKKAWGDTTTWTLQLLGLSGGIDIPARERLDAKFRLDEKAAGGKTASSVEPKKENENEKPLSSVLVDMSTSSRIPVPVKIPQDITDFKLLPGLGRPPAEVVTIMIDTKIRTSGFGSTVPEVLKRLELLMVSTLRERESRTPEATTRALNDYIGCNAALWRLMHAEVLTVADGQENNGLRVMAQLASFALEGGDWEPDFGLNVLRMAGVWMWGTWKHQEGDMEAIREKARESVQTDGMSITRYFGRDVPRSAVTASVGNTDEELGGKATLVAPEAIQKQKREGVEDDADTSLESMEYIEPSAMKDDGDDDSVQSSLSKLESTLAIIENSIHGTSSAADFPSGSIIETTRGLGTDLQFALSQLASLTTTMNALAAKVDTLSASSDRLANQISSLVANNLEMQEFLHTISTQVHDLSRVALSPNSSLEQRVQDLEIHNETAEGLIKYKEDDAKSWYTLYGRLEREMEASGHADALTEVLWPQGYESRALRKRMVAALDVDTPEIDGKKVFDHEVGNQAGRGQGGGGLCVIM
ncbi:hypothetical protein QTJ16_004494 [Diplocarpon rosae]|uniref:Uncharacterized protein n=1 Tax=Diplocarpon rosae TaxID=946125 RepID=A0AAD9SZ92_9HELO|nr:hypothetical protein QTJ16_004494 [Diplocarpon rosae]